MPKKESINKILIIGSGPIIIGQACEFDYSGTQACKALKRLGYEIVLVNSNPATIMTDPNIADATYIEPLNKKRLTEIIAKERPDALLPNLGGQSGLNLCSELAKAGVLKKYNVEVIGVNVETIEKGEDRISFKETMDKLGIEIPRSFPAYSEKEALEIAKQFSYPMVIRPAYTMGGTGSGMVYDEEELKMVVNRGLAASLVGQVLIEESIIGWEELELEVVRDAKGQIITVCFIENIDPMGVHTGDSFCSAPMLTISEELQQRLRDQAYKIVEAIGVVGGTNVQFAHDPVSDRIVVIEINPRTSRSSALASKATGFPIALISSMLAAGLTLDEIPCGKYGTLDKYTPGGDYIVIKFARWAFEKFPQATDILGTQMKAVGEVMSIGKTYKEALQKAIRSLETGRHGLGYIRKFQDKSLEELINLLQKPSSERQFIMYQALKMGATIEQLHEITKIKKWFIEQMAELVELEKTLEKTAGDIFPQLLKKAKQDGFSDKYIAQICNCSEEELRLRRQELNIVQGYGTIHVSGTENSAYYYSSYHIKPEKPRSPGKRVMVLGGGPNRIGQGIEFDYCCVHAALALRKLGIETIMVNCNPETVSTDYDTSDKLYFEPLTLEDVLSIYNQEQPLGIISQFGGQTPLNLATELEKAAVKILGTSPKSIDLAEDRDHFRVIMDELDIPMPPSAMAINLQEAIEAAKKIGYPLMLRPSYVLGGRGMKVVYDQDALTLYMEEAKDVTPERPILIDRFLDNALECEADAIADGKNVFVPAVMEHIELAGIHSGDSSCVLPSVNIPQRHLDTINDYTQKIAKALDVKGLMNMQYAIFEDTVYVLEANPRASRTVPLISKVCNIDMVPLATQIISVDIHRQPCQLDKIPHKKIPYYGVKEAVFPFNMFPEVDPVLGPEMRSTGEVMGIANTFGEAFFKAQEAANNSLPLSGTVLFSVKQRDKAEMIAIAQKFSDLGFKILATDKTKAALDAVNIASIRINKLFEGSPHIVDAIGKGLIDIIINSTDDSTSVHDGSYISKAAIKYNVSYITTMAAAKAAVKGIEAQAEKATPMNSLQFYHSQLK
ncbi:MAG: carbamoyl-phosphate synthase large subunit [Bacillota bacterium]|jgi:carbamoyl-phosphate synthase large subunit